MVDSSAVDVPVPLELFLHHECTCKECWPAMMTVVRTWGPPVIEDGLFLKMSTGELMIKLSRS